MNDLIFIKGGVLSFYVEKSKGVSWLYMASGRIQVQCQNLLFIAIILGMGLYK